MAPRLMCMLLIAVAATAQQPPQSTPAYGAFAFSNPAHFAELGGTIFRAEKAGINPGDACLLAPESLLAGAQVLKTEAVQKPLPCGAADVRRVYVTDETGPTTRKALADYWYRAPR